MTVVSVDTDHDNFTVTRISDFDAPVERVWELWADPRKLERCWGPPSYPATFETHSLVPGGQVRSVDPPVERWLSTGMREGTAQAVAQMDELLRP
jgi:uncharacterized protein YndB with AHSA1/START domain